MATKKKGCGFLIAALLLLIVGGVIAFILGKGAASAVKDFTQELGKTGTSFVTPETVTYTTDEDSAVTVWLTGELADADINKVLIHVTDTSTNTTSTATKPSGSGTLGNKHLLATFEVNEGQSYQVKASGIEDGRHLTIASISASKAISMVSKGIGAFASLGIFGFLALIFGIIGLIRFLGSKSSPPQAPPAA